MIYGLSSTAGGGKYPGSPVVLYSQSPTYSMGPGAATKTLVTPSSEGDPVLGDCTLLAARTNRLPSKGNYMQKHKYTKKRSKNNRKASTSVDSGPVVHPDAAGADIHPTAIFIAVPPGRDAPPVRKFSTFTRDLLKAVDWLKQCRIRTVAMESTGVYWIPLYQMLNDHGLQVCLVNARHVKNVPGRKTDVSDAQWLQYLHSVGLLRGSFRPPQEICALRSISRHRESLLEMGAVHIQHMQKALDQMNLHLHHVIDDIVGVTGLAIIEAILAGERDVKRLAELRHYRIQSSESTIMKALEGDYRREHLFVLRQSLNSWKHLQQQIAECDAELESLTRQLEAKSNHVSVPLAPRPRKKVSKNQPKGEWQQLLAQAFGVDLTGIPGVKTATAQALFMELGTDWSCFPTPGDFSSWLNLCPNSELSNGKVVHRHRRRTQKRLRCALRMAALSLHHNRGPLGSEFRRRQSQLGPAGAITAMAHKLGRITWHLVTYKTPYDESVFLAAEQKHQQRQQKNLIKRIESMGYHVVAAQQPPPAAIPGLAALPAQVP
jgi:transposase